MYRFFVEDEQIEEPNIRIIGEDVNHIAHVLRLLVDEKIIISNGQGLEYCCIIENVEKHQIKCRICSVEKTKQELSTKIYLFQGLPKLDKMEMIIQKCVELGVHEIIPVKMARSIVKINGQNSEKKNDRWQKIANAAAKQSHRGILPQVHEPMNFDEAVKYASQLDLVMVPYEKALDIKNSKNLLLNARCHSSIGVFIGPEGGFEDVEIHKLEEKQASIVSLGKRILRTETASLVILSLLMYNLEED